MRMVRILLCVMALSALVWSPVAVAKEYAPPGQAGTSEYAEDIPTAGGNGKTPAEGGGNRTAAQIDHLGAGEQGLRKLARLGSTGAAAAQLVEATAPANVRSSRPDRGAGSRRSAGTRAAHRHPSPVASRSATLSAAGGSAIAALSRVVDGSDVGGIGVFVPLLLGLGLVWACAVAFLRVRRRPAAGTPEL